MGDMMVIANQPILANATSTYPVSDIDDLELRFEELIETYFSSPVDERINLVFEYPDYSCPGDLLRVNLITKGQFLLCVVNEFAAELLNGGLAQFLVNKPDWIADVSETLSVLEMTDFLAEFRNQIDLLQPLFATFPLLEDQSLRVAIRDLHSRYNKLAKHLSGTLIDRHFTMKWSEEDHGLYWDSSQWSQQLIEKMIDYAVAHPSEFRHIS